MINKNITKINKQNKIKQIILILTQYNTIQIINNKYYKQNREMPTFNQSDNLRVTQLVEDFHPLIRRRAVTSIRTSYPGLFPTQTISNILPIDQSQRLIYEQYNKIHTIIDLVDEHIRRRIECYENQVVNVVQKQIQSMREQTAKVVQQFNKMIQQKNKEKQILSLNNQLDYFKNQAKNLFQSNKILNKNNQQLKKINQQFIYELQNKQIVMQKLLLKYKKQKYHKQKIKQKMNLKKQLIKLQAEQQNQLKSNLINIVLQKNNNNNNNNNNNQLVKMLKTNQKNHKQLNNMNYIQQHQIRQSKNNSILKIQYDQQQQNIQLDCESNMSVNASSVIFTDKKQMKSQQTQVNIFLSENDYKFMFQNNVNKKKKKFTYNQIATQTDEKFNQNIQKYYKNNQRYNYSQQYNQQYNKKHSNSQNKMLSNSNFHSNNQSPNGKHSSKSGFYKNQLITTNYNSKNNNFNPQSSKLLFTKKQRIQRLSTQPYSQTHNNFDFSNKRQFKTNKNININHISQMNPKYKKMVLKFQSSKIIKKVFSREKINMSYNC